MHPNQMDFNAESILRKSTLKCGSISKLKIDELLDSLKKTLIRLFSHIVDAQINVVL